MRHSATKIQSERPGPEFSRRGAIFCLSATAALAAPSLSIGRAAAGIRRIRMTCSQSGEFLDMVYWVDGDYYKEALSAIDYFMRDVRENAQIKMDRRNIDNVAATQRLLESAEPFNLVSGYRTKKTNDMLSGRSNGVASNSLHVKGMAADVQMRNRSVARIAAAARHCGAGGVGTYESSNFVHVDCGRTRSW